MTKVNQVRLAGNGGIRLNETAGIRSLIPGWECKDEHYQGRMIKDGVHSEPLF